MGRASSSKKVARAAKASGRPGTKSSLVWPVSIGLVVLLGVGLIAISAIGRDNSASAGPILGDHWHAAYGIQVCGEWLPPLVDVEDDTTGLHTHGDGLIHLHPGSTSYTGDGASLNAWGEVTGVVIGDGELTLPDRQLTNGDDCGGEPGVVQLKVWDSPQDTEGRVIESDLGDHIPADGEVVTVAFLPEGEALEQPPTVPRLQDPTAPEEGRPLVPLPEGEGVEPTEGASTTPTTAVGEEPAAGGEGTTETTVVGGSDTTGTSVDGGTGTTVTSAP